MYEKFMFYMESRENWEIRRLRHIGKMEKMFNPFQNWSTDLSMHNLHVHVINEENTL